MEPYEHAVSVGKEITVVALDYVRCGKMVSDGMERMGSIAAMNTKALAQLLYGLGHTRYNSHLRFVSFSNRQSEKINEVYFKNDPRINLDHLDAAVAILSAHWQGRLQASVDKRFFLDQEAMDGFPDKKAFKAYVQEDMKTTLVAKIRAAYPEADRFVFIDDKWENLPQAVVDRVDVVQFAPSIMPPGSVRYNEKAF